MLLKKIYEEYKQDVFKYLVSLTHDTSLSEDLVSETFLGALKSLHKFKGESSIKTWLFSIARNKWYEYLRKEKYNISIDDLAYNYILSESDLDDVLIKRELYNKIINLLKSEPPRTEDIILMRIKGYSYFEIGKKHDISESSARVIDYRTKKKIKEILVKEGIVYE
ncbi:RNA polymerase sigma factor [Romboutsia ilealis]|uniref:RNA polymerase sigma factor n=1 Tax=Romboutsia faecis TaxID=2764597 RepID=A0ABR7JQ95_9FIRM|nr:RNA polymerase sigma factor [Romboutsia faecis]MBC5996771.1 RNA polymerase sigma factor [Romboutsia faecis]MRN24298.1 RNA polymerase sigma factor [Romboutsia ilealis]